jgi:hypothetical protein
MQTPISKTKRRLRSYREVVGNIRHQRSRKHRTLREAGNQADSITDVQYHVTALPKDASHSEKMARLSELADTITNVENSDVFLISMWIGED